MSDFKFKRGDVVRLAAGSNSERWFQSGSTDVFLVEWYPSRYWPAGDVSSKNHVDLVKLDGSPMRFTGYCINACANAFDCVIDPFLSPANHAANEGGSPVPAYAGRRSSRGFQLNAVPEFVKEYPLG